MKKFNKTTHIGELLNKTVFGDISKPDKVSQIAKHATIFSFWNSVVGNKFSRYTKPYSIKYSKLYVSVKSPVIVQELNLYKKKILSKINSYSMPLGIELVDIVFNYKNYHADIPESLNQKEDKPILITKDEIEKIEISDDIKEKISNNINKIKFLNNSQKEDFIQKIISTYKAKNLQE